MSQGALITSLCRRHLTIAQRARIHVVVLGGAASITDRQYGSSVNYYCTNEVRPPFAVSRSPESLSSTRPCPYANPCEE